jgi:tetratricopeptide (TPR) repeat protein
MNIDERRFRELFHAYELGGMLTDEERQAVELYLLEHDELLQEAIDFHPVIKEIRSNPKVHETIDEIIQPLEPGKTTGFLSRIVLERLSPKMLSIIVGAVIILFLILKPWHIGVQPTKEAIAAANSIAVMYFQNLADISDTKRLGEIATSLLITDLSESDYMRILSSQRLYDILNLLGFEKSGKIDIQTATSVAKKADARWILMGNILQEEPEMIISSQLIDVKSGLVEKSEKVIGRSGENIFSLVDKLSSEIRNDLALPSAADMEPERNVADITTTSPEAYRLYLEGLEYNYKFYFDESEECFREAIRLDSTLAMGHYYLSFYGQTPEQQESIQKAARFQEHCSKKERLFINSRLAWLSGDCAAALDTLNTIARLFPDEKEAYYRRSIYEYWMHRYDEAILNALKAIQIDPRFKVAYNQLAYLYMAKGEKEEAIKTIDKYISVAPNEANPYDSRGDIFVRLGNLNEAIKSYEKALEIKPDYNHSLRALARLHLSRLEFDKAAKYFSTLASSENASYRVSGQLGEAYALIYQGRFNDALKTLDAKIKEIENSNEKTESASISVMAHAHFLKSKIYYEQSEYKKALFEIEQYIKDFSEANSTPAVINAYFRAFILAAMGDYSSAEQFSEKIKQTTDSVTSNYYDYYLALGSIAYFKGELLAAADLFDRATIEYECFQDCYLYGKTLLEAGMAEKAILVFRKQQYIYAEWATFNGLWDAKMPYYWGLAFEQANLPDSAISKYGQFLEIWKNADAGIKEIADAKIRLSRLKSGLRP